MTSMAKDIELIADIAKRIADELLPGEWETIPQDRKDELLAAVMVALERYVVTRA